jgi:hypothetical protein
MFYVEISDSWLRQEAWSSDIYEQSLILIRVQKTGHSYESQQKRPGQILVIFATNENNAKVIMT